MSLFRDLLECQNTLKNTDTSEINESKNVEDEVNEEVEEEYEESVVLESLDSENESDILSLSVCESCGALHESTEEKCECGGELTESMKLVVRAGKVVKRRVKSKRGKMSSKQKSALAKARKKAHSSGANKARAKSMKVRSKKIKEEINEAEDFECPVCDYVGPMDKNEDGYYVCPECGAELELNEVEEACGDKKSEKCGSEDEGCKTKKEACASDKKGSKKEGCKKGSTNESVEDEVTLDPSLVKYVEALNIDKEIVSKGDKAVRAFLVKEYGIFL